MKKNKSLNPSSLRRGVLKVFLLMRLSVLIIIITSFQLSAKTFSQDMLTVKLNNLDLSRALKEVEKKSN